MVTVPVIRCMSLKENLDLVLQHVDVIFPLEVEGFRLVESVPQVNKALFHQLLHKVI